MTEEQQGKIERFPPVMLHSILSAVRRFEPDFYNHLCRRYHLDADRILGLFGEIDMLGTGQIIPVLSDLREHSSYHDILFLAGRNALVEYLNLQQHKPNTASDNRYRNAVDQLLPVFCGRANFSLMMRGDVHFLEMWNSIFARDQRDIRNLCSFYVGLLTELGTAGGAAGCQVTEVRCCAVEHNVGSCLFQIGIE